MNNRAREADKWLRQIEHKNLQAYWDTVVRVLRRVNTNWIAVKFEEVKKNDVDA